MSKKGIMTSGHDLHTCLCCLFVVSFSLVQRLIKDCLEQRNLIKGEGGLKTLPIVVDLA